MERGTRLPNDWKPSAEEIDFCRKKRPDLDPHDVADEFRDYWTALPGKAAYKLDWSATWRNCVRRAKKNYNSYRFYAGQTFFKLNGAKNEIDITPTKLLDR